MSDTMHYAGPNTGEPVCKPTGRRGTVYKTTNDPKKVTCVSCRRNRLFFPNG